MSVVTVDRAKNMIDLTKEKKSLNIKGSADPLGSAKAVYDKMDRINNWLNMCGTKSDYIADRIIFEALSIDEKDIDMSTMKSNDYEEEFLCIGLGSKQRNGMHILFLDLDKTTKEQAERIAKRLISSVGCSACFIIQSSKNDDITNHHLVCFDIFSFKEVQKIAEEYAHSQWAKFRGDSKDFVLRIGPKMRIVKRKSVISKGDKEISDNERIVFEEVKGTEPQLVSVIDSPFSYRSKSNSLRKIFSSVWGYSVAKDNSFTDSEMFRFHCYRVRLQHDSDNNIIKKVDFNVKDNKSNLKPEVKEKMIT